MTEDQRWMAQALRLAAPGRYSTMPNPCVGCVLVRNGAVVGEGTHWRAGEPHAEVHALRQAGEAAHGATAYVTLEPCSHHGRTPPCADALVAAGVKRVVVAMQDPNPRVAGRGLARLQAAGIVVSVGCLESAARELNLGFIQRMTRQRPWVRIKMAASLDGRTALASGASQWITGAAARADVQHWRARAGAILTGSGTVLTDDPRLTVRFSVPELLHRDGYTALDAATLAALPAPAPLRVVLDSRLRTPETARLLAEGPAVLLTHPEQVATETAERLRQRGAVIEALPATAQGALDLSAVLDWLAQHAINEVHVEAGARLAGALVNADLVDEWLLYQAPCWLGSAGRPVWEGSIDQMSQCKRLVVVSQERVGTDWRWRLRGV